MKFKKIKLKGLQKCILACQMSRMNKRQATSKKIRMVRLLKKGKFDFIYLLYLIQVKLY